MVADEVTAAVFPRALESYPPFAGSLWQTLAERAHAEPFNVVATAIFAIAILHTFAAARFSAMAHEVQHRHDQQAARDGRAPTPSVVAEMLHFLGEVEVVFGMWAGVLMAAVTLLVGWDTARHYLDHTVNFTEPIFVVVIMALAATRPIVTFTEGLLRRLADVGGGTPAAWWFTILTVGPVLGSFITEPAAMTICALLLRRQFFDLEPDTPLKYGTLGLLFVNVSIGGTLTHFAAPPVLMVARLWEWDTAYMLSHFGWRSVLGILVSTTAYFLFFRARLAALARRAPVPEVEIPEDDAEAPVLLPVPGWLIAVHLLFLAWTVLNSHYPAVFVGGFLFFLGLVRATAAYQSRVELRMPLLVGFFLGGLVIHGGLQAWWIAPVLSSLTETPMFLGSALMTAFNDNALITYLSTLVPDMDQGLKAAVIEGAVAGGGLTVIANAPNPAGQALLSRFFGGSISPLGLLAGAMLPTVVAAVVFRII